MAIAMAQQATSPLEMQLGMYLRHLREFRQVSPHTLQAYEADARGFLRWIGVAGLGADTGAVTLATLTRYLSAQPGLSPNTLRRRVHGLSGWFQFMVRQGLLDRNPTDGLPLPKRKRAVPRYPTAGQVELLFAAAKTPLERATIWLLAGTGVRRAELLGLDLDDIAEDLAELRVLGKGSKERWIPVPVAVQEVLREYLEARGDAPGALLLNRAGKRLGITSLRRIIARLARRAGLADCGFTCHSMRHGYATMLVQSGVDVGTIRDLLGHSDVAVTSVYLHSDLRSRRDAVERLPLGSGGGEGNED